MGTWSMIGIEKYFCENHFTLKGFSEFACSRRFPGAIEGAGNVLGPINDDLRCNHGFWRRGPYAVNVCDPSVLMFGRVEPKSANFEIAPIGGLHGAIEGAGSVLGWGTDYTSRNRGHWRRGPYVGFMCLHGLRRNFAKII